MTIDNSPAENLKLRIQEAVAAYEGEAGGKVGELTYRHRITVVNDGGLVFIEAPRVEFEVST